jgi:hypothetical protein
MYLQEWTKKPGIHSIKSKYPIFLSANFLSNYFAGAGAGAGAASGAGAGAGAAASGAGAGAGASTAGASGAGSSAFLHPTTERDTAATNSIATKMANIFFIITSLLSKI